MKIIIRALWIAFVFPITLSFGEQTFSDGPEAFKVTQNMPKVSVDGNRFVNADGETVVFRGLCLVDPLDLEKRGIWGREYFEAAKSWNANIVRVPIHPAAWREKGRDAYLALLDQAIQWSAELEMHVIIDWHTIGNPLTEIFHRDMYETSKAETFRFWYTIAERYKGNPTVAIYELWNEPTNRNGRMGRMDWVDFKAYIEELIYMLRAIDPTCIPLVAGPNWGYFLTGVREHPIDFEGVAYASHPYPQKRQPPWPDQWEEDWGFVAQTYPMICTEFGFMSADGPGAHIPVISDETYGHILIDYFEERGISWTAWVFDNQWSPQLFEDENYTPTTQGKLFRQKLLDLNK